MPSLCRPSFFVWPFLRSQPRTPRNSSIVVSLLIQMYRVILVVLQQGWVDLGSGSSPGWWAAPAATCCPKQDGGLSQIQPSCKTTRINLVSSRKMEFVLPKKVECTACDGWLIQYKGRFGLIYIFGRLPTKSPFWHTKEILRQV